METWKYNLYVELVKDSSLECPFWPDGWQYLREDDGEIILDYITLEPVEFRGDQRRSHKSALKREAARYVVRDGALQKKKIEKGDAVFVWNVPEEQRVPLNQVTPQHGQVQYPEKDVFYSVCKLDGPSFCFTTHACAVGIFSQNRIFRDC